jgi:hypothetical protein
LVDVDVPQIVVGVHVLFVEGAEVVRGDAVDSAADVVAASVIHTDEQVDVWTATIGTAVVPVPKKEVEVYVLQSVVMEVQDPEGTASTR